MDNIEVNGIKRVTNWGNFFKGFKLKTNAKNELEPLTYRIAQLLDWAARKGPGVFIPPNIVVKYIMGYSHTPRMSNDEVIRLRGRLSNVRPILQRVYHRDLKNGGDIGVRATVDSLDVVKSTTGSAVRRVNSAVAALERNTNLVDATKLPKAGDDKRWTDWYSRSVSPAIKALSNDDRIKQLLLPPANHESDNKPTK